MTAQTPAILLVYAVLEHWTQCLLDREGGTRSGHDPEDLHQMRVAVRRLRDAIRFYADLLPVGVVRLRTELRWLGRALGEVRDCDVHLQQVMAAQATCSEDDRQALADVTQRLVLRREGARRRMLRALETRRYARLIERLRGRLRRGPPRRSRALRVTIGEAAPSRIRKRYRRVLALARRIDASSPPELYHRLRIRTKGLRYALEIHREVWSRTVGRCERPVTRLQDLLGRHQDACVAGDWLRELIAAEGRRLAPRAAFVVGLLVAEHERRAAKLRRTFPERLAPLAGRRMRALMDELATAPPTADDPNGNEAT
jgi:CHAD domain-containing protein